MVGAPRRRLSKLARGRRSPGPKNTACGSPFAFHLYRCNRVKTLRLGGGGGGGDGQNVVFLFSFILPHRYKRIPPGPQGVTYTYYIIRTRGGYKRWWGGALFTRRAHISARARLQKEPSWEYIFLASFFPPLFPPHHLRLHPFTIFHVLFYPAAWTNEII